MRVSWVVLAVLSLGAAGHAQSKPAKLTGRVASDTTMRPIAGAEVSIQQLGLSAQTDDRGGFTLANVPAGTHRVRARKLGYAMYDMSVQFGAGENVPLAIVLPRVTTLDTITTVGDPNVPLSFLDHRAIGLGYFMTRADLEKFTGRQLSQVFNQAPGAGLVRGRVGQAWIQSKRFTAPIRSMSGVRPDCGAGGPIWCPEPGGAPRGCYARVYLDRTLLNRGSPAEPININEYAPENLEAIEYFGSPAQMPVEYNTLNSACGVLVLHTRRSK